MRIEAARPAEHPVNPDLQSAIQRATRRLAPWLMAMYVVSFLDRANIGFSKVPRMRSPSPVCASSSQLATTTSMVVTMTTLRHHENSMPPNVKYPDIGSLMYR